MLSRWIHNPVAVLKEEANSLAIPSSGCNVLSKCCNSYEFCVSCCLHPEQTQKEQVLKLKMAKPLTSGTYPSVFDFCAGRCRHNSESVVHENAYVSDFHHCFSLPSNSSGSTVSPVEAKLNGINVAVGSAWLISSGVCSSVWLIYLQFSMQKYMSCKGACLASVGTDQPAEVVDDAPKHLEHACILEHNQCCLVVVLIGIPGDFAPVLSALLWGPIHVPVEGVEESILASKALNSDFSSK
ncbi:hypothetical protein F3Y22_tig00110764pilonHSYRG00067 [Hibiscus syriacus]|uniref:SREBP regulating gene protein n=1 Tax=Hibiscus syriacus TaxID=106335 RepID=A0A6A2ZSJ3_HIBSY|nr:hypothetical protein F3Y22_tig00110764pilonHSYRG00067 [Hibiscus syriacus]